METRVEFSSTREAQLEELEAKFAALQEKAKKASDELKIGFDEQVYEIEQKRNAVIDKMEQLRRSKDQSWQDIRDDLDQALLDLSTALDVAATRFE